MRLTAMEGGLHTCTGSPGSFLLFVGFYAHLYFVHPRTGLVFYGFAYVLRLFLLYYDSISLFISFTLSEFKLHDEAARGKLWRFART